MDDDLNTSRAIGVVHETVREGNAVLAAERDASGHLAAVRGMLTVLGLDPVTQWPSTQSGGELHKVVDALIAVALDQRQAARARKDFTASDAIRDQLKQAGILVEDTPHGPRWTLSDGVV
jgi:cysteinyl-tRNA synthetase